MCTASAALAGQDMPAKPFLLPPLISAETCSLLNGFCALLCLNQRSRDLLMFSSNRPGPHSGPLAVSVADPGMARFQEASRKAAADLHLAEGIKKKPQLLHCGLMTTAKPSLK